MNWKFNEDKTRILLDGAPRRPKKLTGTRLASIFGLDPWKSAFKTWCEICRVYEDEFAETKYTQAGRVIEPILIAWAKKEFENGVLSPQEFYGNAYKDVMKKYDFYPENKIFGGMWDARIYEDGIVYADIEFKTSSRPQDWVGGVPSEKKVQSLLYSCLDNAKKTFTVVAFLSDEDYMHPERFVPILGENVKIYSFDTFTETIKVDGEEYTIGDLVEAGLDWWNTYVLTGISPIIDPNVDEVIIKALKTQRPDQDVDNDLKTLLTKVEELEYTIAKKREETGLDALERELLSFKDALKKKLIGGMTEDDTQVEVGKWYLTKVERTTVDTDALKKDGIYDKYTKNSVSYMLKSKGEKT